MSAIPSILSSASPPIQDSIQRSRHLVPPPLNPETGGFASAPPASMTVPTPCLQGTPGFCSPIFTPLFPCVSVPCPASQLALQKGGAAVVAAASASYSRYRRCRRRRRAGSSNQAQRSDFAGPGLSAETPSLFFWFFWGPEAPSRAWGKPPFAGDREGGAWNRSQRHPLPDQQDRTG